MTKRGAMNDIGAHPWLETWIAWKLGCEPSLARVAASPLNKVAPDHVADFLHVCESPMERLFVLGFHFAGETWKFRAGNRHMPANVLEVEVESTADGSLDLVYIAAQVAVSRDDEARAFARCDFLLCRDYRDRDVEAAALLIEIDGHDYHERTKEQAQADRSRDRAILRAGHNVIRFTGSEVHADPYAVAAEAYETLRYLEDAREIENHVAFMRGYAAGYQARGVALQTVPEAAE